MTKTEILSLNDMLNALKRSPKYREDFDSYIQYCVENNIKDKIVIDWLCPTPLVHLSESAQALCTKYGIPFPIHPSATIQHYPDKRFIPIEEATDFPAALPLPLKLGKDGKTYYGLKDRRYLTVQLDFDRTQDEIIRAIRRLYKFYTSQAKGNKRHRTTELSPWKIYDEVKIRGKAFTKIAKEITGINENPSYNETVDAARKKVREAYEKAKAMLAAFEK